MTISEVKQFLLYKLQLSYDLQVMVNNGDAETFQHNVTTVQN
jgi:hypothetical protein